MEIEINVHELKALMDSATPPLLIDVREPWENERCAITGAKLMPMQTVPGSIAELKDETRDIVVHCHHGGRSMRVVHWLRSQGVNASNLAGGIDQWSVEIDPTIARY